MVPHALIICESEVYITAQLHSRTSQELFKKYSVIKVAAMKNTFGAAHPSYCLKLKYPLPFSVSYAQLITQ